MLNNPIKNFSMKKLVVLSMAFFFTFSLVFGQNVKMDKEKIKETKKELKIEKRRLKTENKTFSNVQKDEASDIVKDNFYADFGNVPNVKWNRVDLYDEATFMKDGKEMRAFYDFDSHLVGTTQVKTFADLPSSAQKEIKKQYPDYSIGAVIYFDNNNSDESAEDLVLLYGIQFESQDNYFVELIKGTKKVVVQVLDSGEVFFYEDLR